MWLRKILGLAVVGSLLSACDGGTDGSGGIGGSGGATSQGGGGGSPCAVPGDCPTPTEKCRIPTCNGGVCGVADEMDGKEVEPGTTCKTTVCMAGAPTDQFAPAGTACTEDGGTVCDGAGECVGCATNADCMDPTKPWCAPEKTCMEIDCMNGVKDGPETDVDCGGLCPPCEKGKGCLETTDCAAGVCEASDGICCDMACDQTCQSCKLPGMEGTCIYIQQGQDPEDECPGTQVCDGNTICVKLVGETCSMEAECLSGNCVDGVCCNLACNGVCQACNLAGSEGTCTNVPLGEDPSDECADGACTGAATCQKANGGTCNNATQCGSGFCVDGVCCDTACDTKCVSCVVAGSAGACTNIPAGTDPDGECAGGTPNCNGNGVCGN